MPLTTAQRLHRLRVRAAELPLWRVRARAPIAGWRCDGEPIASGAPWPRIEGLARLAAEAEAPADWPLEATRLSLNVGGESLLSLAYGDSVTERFGLDPNHEEFPLRARAVSISTESVARLPFGQPVRAPKLERAEFVWVDRAVDALHLLLTQVAEAIAALAEHECVPHLLEAAEAALRGLDWPSDSQAYVARITPSSRQQTIWRLPPVGEAPPGLDASQRASVEAAHFELTARIAELRLRFPPRGRLALTGHAHIDLAWLWPYDETRRKLRRTLHTALDLLRRYPEFHFNQSTAHYYAQLEEDDPELFARIIAAAGEGRWEALGGMWVEPDTNMPTGESLVRQLLYGQRYFARVFGAPSRICWLPDCFGFSPALPQLLRQAGIDSFFTIKVNWSETNKFPHDLFWWEGLDGARVLAHTFDNPHGGYNGEVRPDALQPTWTSFRGKIHHDTSLLSVGYGDGGGGVTPEMLERARQLKDFPALPEAHWGRVDEFFAAAHASAATRALPVWSGEIYLELHRATLTSQSGVKREHRRAERALITAEIAASLAHLLGAEAPESLEGVWRGVLKNEFHDILPGSSIREVYEDAERELTVARNAGLKVQAAALAKIAALWPKGPLVDGLLVVNPGLHARLLDLTLADGTRLASAGIVAPLGIAVLDRAALAPQPGLIAEPRRLENAHLSARFSDDGALASLVHKATGREALAGRGNQLWAYPQDKPCSWDAWDVEEDYAARGEEVLSCESFALVEAGPHVAGLRIVRRWRHSTITQTYRLAANGRRLDIETHIDWRDRRVFLRSLTPVAARARHAVFECAFGVIERPTHANTSWEQAAFETVAHRFVDLAEPGFGLALLNDAKYGHSVAGNVLGLSLVRSPTYPDPFADEGEQTFTYALMPHEGAWHKAGVREEAENLNQPLLVAMVSGLSAGERAPLGVTGPNPALATLKRAENAEGLILRLYEPAGGRGPVALSLPEGWRASAAVDLMEAAVEAGEGLAPFEVKGWRLGRG